MGTFMWRVLVTLMFQEGGSYGDTGPDPGPVGGRTRYWYYIWLHTTIWMRRSRAFKQYKVYQNRTIIKEVRSKNVLFLLTAQVSGPSVSRKITFLLPTTTKCSIVGSSPGVQPECRKLGCICIWSVSVWSLVEKILDNAINVTRNFSV